MAASPCNKPPPFLEGVSPNRDLPGLWHLASIPPEGKVPWSFCPSSTDGQPKPLGDSRTKDSPYLGNTTTSGTRLPQGKLPSPFMAPTV